MSPSLNVQHPGGNSSSPNNRRVTVGFDYGTHSTKVQIRWRGDHRSRVLLVDDQPTRNYPVFATPSAVRVREGRVFFGHHAVVETGGVFYKSLKTQLLPPDHTLGQEKLVFPDGLEPELLIGCYMAWALGVIAKRLGASAKNVALNVAAPMNHIENVDLKGQYLRIIQAAWEAVFGTDPIAVDQGATLNDLRDFFKEWLGREAPDSSIRRYEVLPETLAPLVSLSEDPKMEPGMHLMVDMGAGTTEYSVNSLIQDHDGPKVTCYTDLSIHLGGDDFETILERIDQKEARLIMLRRFRNAFNQTWLPGFQKDGPRAAQEKWRRLRVLQTGGGGRHPDIQNLLEKELPKPQWIVAEQLYKGNCWHSPHGLILDDLPQVPDRKDLPLLAVSRGLSLERQLWPIYFMPGEVEALPGSVGNWSPLNPTYPDDK